MEIANRNLVTVKQHLKQSCFFLDRIITRLAASLAFILNFAVDC